MQACGCHKAAHVRTTIILHYSSAMLYCSLDTHPTLLYVAVAYCTLSISCFVLPIDDVTACVLVLTVVDLAFRHIFPPKGMNE